MSQGWVHMRFMTKATMIHFKLIFFVSISSFIVSLVGATNHAGDKKTIGHAADEKANYREERILFKQQSTTTVNVLSLLTSTIPYTCYLYAAPLMPCTGRRRRRRAMGLPGQNYPEMSPTSLSGSLDKSPEEGRALQQKRGRILFTVWHSVSSTYTATIFSTNRSVTVSVSAYCTAPNLSVNAC